MTVWNDLAQNIAKEIPFRASEMRLTRKYEDDAVKLFHPQRVRRIGRQARAVEVELKAICGVGMCVVST
jgi:hypothetical protein